MECQVRQVRSDLSAEFVILQGERAVGGAVFPQNFLVGGSCQCRFRGWDCELVYAPGPLGRNFGVPVEERTYMPYTILCGGEVWGGLCDRQVRTGLFSRYGYTALDLAGRSYQMYEVGLGKAGMVWPIWAGEGQAAQIFKAPRVENNLDVYQIRALDRESLRAAVVLCLYLDARSFARRGEIAIASVETQYVYTFNKALKARYDPGFWDRAGAADELQGGTP